jgi:hypothetical protein
MTRSTSTEENSTLTWKGTAGMEGTTNPAMRESEVVTSQNCVVTAGSQ